MSHCLLMFQCKWKQWKHLTSVQIERIICATFYSLTDQMSSRLSFHFEKNGTKIKPSLLSTCTSWLMLSFETSGEWLFHRLYHKHKNDVELTSKQVKMFQQINLSFNFNDKNHLMEWVKRKTLEDVWSYFFGSQFCLCNSCSRCTFDSGTIFRNWNWIIKHNYLIKLNILTISYI